MVSNNQNIISLWIFWHFFEMPKFLILVWKNYLMFATNYFSFILLLKTFFAPWRRYNWRYPKGFDVVEILNTFISNIFSRFLGSVIRIFLIIFGFVFQIFVLTAGAVILLGWIFMPFLVIIGLIFTLYV
ncbi:MAG: hypothetical protein A2599_03690 [Candidatus Staskawiczbacteria bacterium RIFOXYD1_FULL_39_28]|uniref:Uncharacterized protein n=1 Tax=Candidatus Staskawiczbacteria bacterium RIFOXYC1_FULL_38_18 TaxID=1802229 RepID=A0A1G2JCG9_9BACT|nr:MAG: hypothetical protein A2401_01570 [Candidatus Staskawiczbacteria bacterium RIFOXYC1_FULL_38_18]OGZ91540.1 MAG: hypothetical protein A2599_03690 [Candidatus Staskawiczbacteria bacterium RIFOXYD1_FULL_39_28]